MATFPLHYRHAREATNSRKTKRRIERDIPKHTGPVHRELTDTHPRDITILQLINRDGDRCYLCRNTYPAGAYHLEHVIPRSHGGTDALTNLAIACATCNSRKGQHYVSITIADQTPCFWL